jgi:tetratricopeptide (TPR) repeat protein/serine phosphatase RsbU (regulator of sigma subunit)
MKIFIILLIAFFSIVKISFAQLDGKERIDSLLKELPFIKKDTNAVNLLGSLSFEFRLVNPEDGIKYGEKGFKIAENINWELGKAKCYNSLGLNSLMRNSNEPKALEYFLKALKINEDIKNRYWIAINLGNIGLFYQNQSDYHKALDYYHKALQIDEELGNKNGVARHLGNIGIIYRQLADFPKALECYFKALKIDEELGNKNGIALHLGNIGIIYQNQSNYTKALEYYHNALKIDEELGNKNGVARHLGNIGVIYQNQIDYPKALAYFLKALEINQDLGNKSEIASNLGYIGGLYLNQAMDSTIENSENRIEMLLNREVNLNKAIYYSKTAYDLLKEIGAPNSQSYILYIISKAYQQKGDYKNAYETFIKHKKLQDSVFSIDRQKEIANLDAKRENELKDKEIVILQSEKKAQQFQSYLLGGGVIVLFGAFGLAFLRFREKKKLSDELQTQKSIVEEKNEEIVSSITYASTIQHAILPWESTMQKAFSDIFIFYKPKDIVSGDSYWFQEIDGIKFFAVIDCTGHGIPGAMLTVIASAVLDDAVLSKKLKDTGDILTYMNEKVTEVLNQKLAENKIRDGMEVALIAIHNDKIQFSGAGRPLYLKNGTMEIIKTDKREIAGQTVNDDYQFSSVEIEKNGNMTLYLTSDGFADQMNEQSKKYSTKRFTNLLESISVNPLAQQSKILENEFNIHRGNREQIDDLTIIGLMI